MASGPDLILGVSNAAAAARQRDAAARLERLSREASGPVQASEQTAESEAAWPTDVRMASSNASRAARVLSPSAAENGSDPKAKVYVQFEAVLLQNMIEAMMPKDTEAMTGSGTAGQIWKSMLAEKVAEEIARSGTLGIAKQIAAGEAVRSAAAAAASSKVGKS